MGVSSCVAPVPMRCVNQRLERDAHLAHRAKDAVLGRVGLEAEGRADLVDRAPFDVTQRECGTLQGREPREALGHARVNFGAQHLPVWRWGVAQRDLLRRRHFEVRRIESGFAVTSRPNEVDGTVHGNPMNPGSKIGSRLEAAELPERLEERLLHDVLGIRGLSDQPEHHVMDVAAVSLDERPEGVGIPRVHRRDRGAVALEHLEV